MTFSEFEGTYVVTSNKTRRAVPLHLHSFLLRYASRQTKQQVLPKVIWEERVAFTQLRNKVPVDYNGMPQIHLPQNCLFPFDDHRPI